jgi:hypothetical protein
MGDASRIPPVDPPLNTTSGRGKYFIFLQSETNSAKGKVNVFVLNSLINIHNVFNFSENSQWNRPTPLAK